MRREQRIQFSLRTALIGIMAFAALMGVHLRAGKATVVFADSFAVLALSALIAISLPEQGKIGTEIIYCSLVVVAAGAILTMLASGFAMAI